MRNDFDSQEWAEHRQLLSNGFSQLFATVAEVFRCLKAIQFDAPWQDDARNCTNTLI